MTLPANYDTEIRPNVYSGDAAVCDGGGFLGMFMGKTHVGTIYCAGGSVLIFHATTKDGVHVEDFRSWLAKYKGKVWIRRLNKPLSTTMQIAFRRFRQRECGKPYEKYWPEFIRAILPVGTWQMPWSSKWRYCSELKYALFQAMGLLDPEGHPNDATPDDFAGDFPLLEGYEFRPPWRAKG